MLIPVLPSLPFFLLALAICSVWLPSLKVGSTGIAPWVPLLVLATAAAGWAGIVRWPAAVALAALYLLARGSVRSSRDASRAGLTGLASLAAGRLRFWLPVGISAALFGIAHIAGGVEFAALATVAGAGYALAYAQTGRIGAAILTHFAVNLVRFFGFTYPQLAK